MDYKNFRITDVDSGKWVKFKIYDRNYRYDYADGGVYVDHVPNAVSGANANNWITQQTYGQVNIDQMLRMVQAFEDGKAQSYQPTDIAEKSSDILDFILRRLFIDGYAQPYIQLFPECATPPDVMIDRVHYTVDCDVLSTWAAICRARHLTYEAEILDRAVSSRGGKMVLMADLPPIPATEEMEAMLAEFLSTTF